MHKDKTIKLIERVVHFCIYGKFYYCNFIYVSVLIQLTTYKQITILVVQNFYVNINCNVIIFFFKQAEL